MDDQKTRKRKAVKPNSTGRRILRIFDFASSVGPMIIGMLVGGVVGIVTAISLGFSVFSGLLLGAGLGFLLAILIQAFLIGGGL